MSRDAATRALRALRANATLDALVGANFAVEIYAAPGKPVKVLAARVDGVGPVHVGRGATLDEAFAGVVGRPT